MYHVYSKHDKAKFVTCQQDFVSNPKGFLDRNLNDSALKVLKHFIDYYQIFSAMRQSNGFIALHTKLSVATVKRAKKKLQELGLLIIKRWWGVYATCHYFLADFLTTSSGFSALRRYYKSFITGIFFSLSSLVLCVEPLLTYKEYLLNKTSEEPMTMPADSDPQVDLINGLPKLLWEKTHQAYKKGAQLQEDTGIFTVEQLARIATYPLDAVKYAHSQFALQKDIRNPFAWYIKVLDSYMVKRLHGRGTQPVVGTALAAPKKGWVDTKTWKEEILSRARSRPWYTERLTFEQCRVKLNEEKYGTVHQEQLPVPDIVQMLADKLKDSRRMPPAPVTPSLLKTNPNYSALVPSKAPQVGLNEPQGAPPEVPYIDEASDWEEVL